MRIVGLTGGIACGKSSVTELLRTVHGIPVVDADIGAREVVKHGSIGFQQVLWLFKDHDILDTEGLLDRKKVGEIVFNNFELRSKLNAILHPLIRAWARERFEEYKSQGHKLAFYDAALLVETNGHRELDGFVVVTTNPETQLQRLMKRNGLTEEQAKARIASQFSQSVRVALATYVIDTTGPKEDLAAKVAVVVDQIRNDKRYSVETTASETV